MPLELPELLISLVGVVILLLLPLTHYIRRVEHRLTTLEVKMDILMNHLGVKKLDINMAILEKQLGVEKSHD